jgi:hypothetical protein
MNAAPRLLKHLMFGLLLLASFALAPYSLAQEEDAILQNYSLGVENLSQALSLMPTDGLQSTDALERASQALRFLAGSSNSTALVSQLENTFERAKTTIQNQSQADLGVQVAVLKGGFQRLVYEAAIASANAGDLATTQSRLTRLATDMGFTPEAQTTLSSEANLSKLFTTFEQGSAGIVKADLGNVLGQLETDKGAAYQTLATAYSAFLPVQDSPRASSSSNALFTQSFTALVGDDKETLNQAISELSTQMDALSSAAADVMSGTPPTEAAPVEATTPTETTEVVQPEASATETTATEAPTESAPVETTATTETAIEPAATPVDTAIAPVMNAPVNPFADKLSAELASLGLSPNQQRSVSEQLLADGFTSVKSVVNDVLANTSLAMSAVQEGDQASAKSLLGTVQGTYNTYLSPLVSGKDGALDSSTQSLLGSLIASPSLRQEDVATLNQQWASVGNALGMQTPVSGLQDLANSVTGFWSGWVRMIVMIILGLLAFVPLYLLFLAFGGGNRNWQLIGYALFLLLAPVIYEGLSFLLSLINSFVNLPVLDVLSRFSFLQNPIMQVLWAVLTALAIALATLGLYGICVQFGLIGRKQDDVAGTIVETAPSKTSIESAKTTNFEWDEEF